MEIGKNVKLVSQPVAELLMSTESQKVWRLISEFHYNKLKGLAYTLANLPLVPWGTFDEQLIQLLLCSMLTYPYGFEC